MIVRARLPLILTALLALTLSSARWADTASGAAAAAKKEPTYHISAIKVEQNADEFQLRIQGNTPPTYTMYELFEPLRVVIDVADATLTAAPSLPTDVPQGPILQVTAQVLREQEPAITRVEIVLAEDRGYSVERRGNDVLLAFAKQVKSEKVALPKSKKTATTGSSGTSTVQVETGGPVATQLHDLVVDASDPVVTRVFLRANGPIAKYQKAEIKKTASRPDRMYVDIPGVKLRSKTLQQKVGNAALEGVRAAQRNGTVRVVFDSGLKELFAYDVQPQPDGLLVTIAAPSEASALATAVPTPPAATPSKETTPPQPADAKSLTALLLAAENAEELIKPIIPPLKKAKAPQTPATAKATKKAAKKPAKPAAEPTTDAYSFAGYQKQRISVDFYKIDLHNVFRLFGEISGQNIVVDEKVEGTLTLALNEVPWDFALDIILNLKDLQKEERFSTIVIMPKAKQLAWPKAATQNIAISGGEKLEPISIKQRIETPKGVVEAKALIRDASALDKKGEYAGAMALYEKALALWPDNGQLAGRMATLCLIHLGQNAKAAHYAKAAFAADPSNLNAALQAAIALANMKKVPEAKEYFDKAINSDQAAAEALLSYAAFAEEYNSYNGAIALLQRHTELHGETLDSMIAAARLFDKKGDRQAAAAQYRTILLSGYELPADLQQYIKGRLAAADTM
ncbi:MAG TPA: AMIN domain-containing protein [Desulfurivibrionaceae bacterium]|nr:AMIN domain-containing protein [Desulfurivibrionaceae bacterium]